MAPGDPRYPNLFIPGAMRSGTTTLEAYLARQDAVFIPSLREPHGLLAEADEREAYLRLYDGAESHRYRLDRSTGYLAHEQIADQISRLAPDARLIVMLRNPIDRAWSHYQTFRSLGEEDRPFEEAFFADLDTREPPYPLRGKDAWLYREYCLMGRYATLLRPYLEALPRRSMLFLTLEDLARDPATVLGAIARFLELPPFPESEPLQRNRAWRLRHPGLYWWIWRGGPGGTIGRMLERVVPEDLRSRVHRRILALIRRRTAGDSPALPDRLRPRLAEVYRGEVAELRKRVDLGLAPWNSDFSTFS